jgi:hypothetical protein
MSMFGSIMSKIFGHPAAAPDAPAAIPTDTTVQQPVAAADAAPGATASQSVDVGAVLAQMAAARGQPSNYKVSIVDLLTLLGLDSSMTARKELASELHYTGSTDDSATMNIWLHKQVMTKLEENGGKVPADLKGA